MNFTWKCPNMQNGEVGDTEITSVTGFQSLLPHIELLTSPLQFLVLPQNSET